MKAPAFSLDSVQEFTEINESVCRPAMDWTATNAPMKYWGTNLSVHPNPITERVRKFCSVDGPGVLLVQGPNGTGKTETLCASMTERFNLGLDPGLYLSCFYQLCPQFRSAKSFSSSATEWDLYRTYYTTPYLILDEPGKGDDKVLEKAVVRNILAARYDNGVKTAICMNWNARELVEWLDNDMASRFREKCVVVSLDGEDWRKKNGQKD